MAKTMLNFTWQQSGEFFIILFQALSAGGILTEIVKATVQQPRPYMHHPSTKQDPLPNGNDDIMSFFSGHATMSSTFASAAVEENFHENFRVNGEMREKICVYDFQTPVLIEIIFPKLFMLY